MHAVGRETLAPLMAEWNVVNSDYFPIVDLGAERARYTAQSANGIRRLNTGILDFTAPFFERRTEFRSDPRYIVPGHRRLAMLARGAAARAAFEADRVPTVEIDAEVKEILDRVWQWKNWVLADRTPPDWDIWARQTVLVEQDLHQGTVGVVDEAFYETLHAYLDRHSPPLDVCAAFTFLEAVRRWDFAPAAKLSAPLVEKAAANESVIPVDRLLAGAVTAAIATGNPTAAEQYVERLGGQLPADLWLKLLRSYARADGGLPTPGASAGHVERSCRPS
jgi:hypothetical protein